MGGSGTGIWACGKCHQIYVLVTHGRGRGTDTNRSRAELCCAPRNCAFCGLPTEPDSAGQYPHGHPKCIPVPEPDTPHPSMASPFARILYHRMSGISEACWCAGWELGNEYVLWKMMHGGKRFYGQREVTSEELEELRVLANHARGWIWTCPPVPQAPSYTMAA
jgi:hypothetical protein